MGSSPAWHSDRVWAANSASLRNDGDYVLYWMIAARRTRYNFGLQRAIEHAHALRKPLIVLEALRVDYPWASDRLHRFVIDGMAANAAALEKVHATYYPYVEPSPNAGKGLLEALAQRACVVVTDYFPSFFLPRMVAAAAQQLTVRLEVVDSNGLLPLQSASRTFSAAAHFRRHVQKLVPEHLGKFPEGNPFAKLSLPTLTDLPREITRRWPPASTALLRGEAKALSLLPIDHSVSALEMRGGESNARAALKNFVSKRLPKYHELHNEPQADGTSRLSPYLHFGHISAHEIFAAVADHEHWSPDRLPLRATGAREDWWKMSAGAEAFLDQLIVWRELGYNMCHTRPRDYDEYRSLPEWARETLEDHIADERPHVYSRAQLENGETHDELWNAAMGQLRREGWFHNYMRMLWGKKILEWSRTPQQALGHMIALMDRWSLDGRNPNAYSGYMWVLGRYDRPWPERPIFGTVRSMSSERTAKKVDVDEYVARYAGKQSSLFA